NGWADIGSGVWDVTARQISAEAHGQLELHHQVDEILAPEPRGRLVNAPLIDHPAARVIDTHELLHDLRRGRDLEPADGAVNRGPQLAQRLLRSVGIRTGRRGDLGGQVTVRCA